MKWRLSRYFSRIHIHLASVNNEFNAVYVYGDAVGETMFYGPGAGSLPTATSVTGDIVAACRNLLLGVNGKRPHAPQYERKVKSDGNKVCALFPPYSCER